MCHQFSGVNCFYVRRELESLIWRAMPMKFVGITQHHLCANFISHSTILLIARYAPCTMHKYRINFLCWIIIQLQKSTYDRQLSNWTSYARIQSSDDPTFQDSTAIFPIVLSSYREACVKPILNFESGQYQQACPRKRGAVVGKLCPSHPSMRRSKQNASNNPRALSTDPRFALVPAPLDMAAVASLALEQGGADSFREGLRGRNAA